MPNRTLRLPTALRLMPGFDVSIGHYTLVPNPFWGGALFPLLVLAALLGWPWLERRVTGDRRAHNVLDRPRDAPWRTAIGAAFLTLVVVVFGAGAMDRVYVMTGLDYAVQLWIFRATVILLPIAVLFMTRRLCLALQEKERIEADQERAEHEAEEARARAPAVP